MENFTDPHAESGTTNFDLGQILSCEFEKRGLLRWKYYVPYAHKIFVKHLLLAANSALWLVYDIVCMLDLKKRCFCFFFASKQCLQCQL